MMHTEHMPSPVRLLLEAHPADMCAWHHSRVGSVGTHALCTFKGAIVEMHHGDMSVQTVAEGEATVASWALVVSLLEMSDAEVLIGISSFCKGLGAGFASKRL